MLWQKRSFKKFYDNFKILYDKWFVQKDNKKSKNDYLRKDWITIGVAISSLTKQLLYANWSSCKSEENQKKYKDYQKVFDIKSLTSSN